MLNGKRIAVVMPAYNAGRYLGQAMRSVGMAACFEKVAEMSGWER